LLFNTSMQQASFAATELQQQSDVLEAKQQSLQMQLAHLRDPQVIALKAQRMGMVLPTSPGYLDLRSGKVAGHPTPATRVDTVRLFGPPPAKPPAYDVQTHRTSNSTADTAAGSHGRTGRAGRNGNTKHKFHSNHTHH
jgi:hypothetical protein